MNILFFTGSRTLKSVYDRYEKRILKAAEMILGEGRGAVEISILGKKKMYGLTGRYFGRSYHTDVIAFDYPKAIPDGSAEALRGEIFISGPEVRRQSEKFEEDIKKTFVFLIVHGLLHVAGRDDGTAEKKERMFRLQEKYCCYILGKG